MIVKSQNLEPGMQVEMDGSIRTIASVKHFPQADSLIRFEDTDDSGRINMFLSDDQGVNVLERVTGAGVEPPLGFTEYEKKCVSPKETPDPVKEARMQELETSLQELETSLHKKLKPPICDECEYKGCPFSPTSACIKFKQRASKHPYQEISDRWKLSTAEKRQTQGGAVRGSKTGKGAFHLLSPHVLLRLAIIMEKGSAHYEERNWEKGMALSEYFDSAKRHLDMYLEGYQDEDHLGQALWNVHGLIHTEEMIRRGLLPADLNDLPDYLTGKRTIK